MNQRVICESWWINVSRAELRWQGSRRLRDGLDRLLDLQLRPLARPQMGREQKRQDWVKLHATTGVITNLITSVMVTPTKAEGTSDSAQFPALLSGTSPRVRPARRVDRLDPPARSGRQAAHGPSGSGRQVTC
jgi:hypothetical protein